MKKTRLGFMARLLPALLLFAGMSAQVCAQEKIPAFPGAEGFGRYTTGGRGGKVYHVTNLKDSGDGSLRWALGQTGAKIIVFDISGTIHLESALNITSNTTIAGQTAPGDGICVADYPVSIKGNNVIVRYMRFRLGNKNVLEGGADGWDGFGGMDQSNIMVDHCSVSWSIDECLSIYGVQNATVQWCISSQSLQDSGHSKGAHGYGGNWGGSGVTYHHNLMAHHESRVPRLGPRYTTQLDERLDMRNNVFYNWAGNGCYGGEAMNVNIVNNYYKPGPGTAQISTTKQKRIAGIGIRTTEYVKTYPDYAPTEHVWGKFYVDGNVNSKYTDVTNDNWTYGIYNQISNSDNDNLYTDEAKQAMRLGEPIDFVVVTTHSANDAYEKVVAYAGCCLSRDAVDELIINDTKNGTATYTGGTYVDKNGKTVASHYGIINTQDDIKPENAGSTWSAWPVLSSTTAPVDTDGDGMPDNWENANGLNASDDTDGNEVADNGYTNVENYLNSLVSTITENQNMGGELVGNVINVDDEPVATEYELSKQTSNSDWTFTNGCNITNTSGKTYADATSCGIGAIKYSKDVTFTINIPDGVSIDKVSFNGYSNNDTGEAYLYQLGANTFSSTDYVFPARTGGTTKSYTIDLDTPVTGSLSFKLKDNQVGMVITLYVATTGIKEVHTMTLGDGDGKIYNLQGIEVKNPTQKGVYIKNGQKFIVR